MIALLGREFVNLPLLCLIAEHSHDASGPPTRGTFGSSLRTSVSSLCLGWFSDWQGSASFCICPCFYPQLGPLPSVPRRVILPRCPLPYLDPCGHRPGPSVWASSCRDPSSLCAPRSERSDPVSADGVLQEPRHLLTVLLRMTNKRLLRQNPFSRLDMNQCSFMSTWNHSEDIYPLLLMKDKHKEAVIFTSFMKA